MANNAGNNAGNNGGNNDGNNGRNNDGNNGGNPTSNGDSHEGPIRRAFNYLRYPRRARSRGTPTATQTTQQAAPSTQPAPERQPLFHRMRDAMRRLTRRRRSEQAPGPPAGQQQSYLTGPAYTPVPSPGRYPVPGSVHDGDGATNDGQNNSAVSSTDTRVRGMLRRMASKTKIWRKR